MAPEPLPTRTTLRWRLTLVYGAVAAGVGLLLLLLSLVLVDRAARAGSLPFATAVLPDGQVLALRDLQDALRQEALRQLSRQGLLVLAVVVAAGVGVSYVLAGRVLRPLSAITATAQRLSAEQLDARLDLPGPHDELKELADVFDAMLGRLQASFEAQRRFVADASHELRTPLAVMRTEVDVALADPDASVDDLRRSAVVVREATERADRLVDSLLLLARTDRLGLDRLPRTEQVDLAAVAASGLRAIGAETAQRGLRVTADWAPARVLGDPVLLERLAGNLVENAVRHNVDGGELLVRTGTERGTAYLLTSNDGAAVAPGEVEALFEPFRRGGTARTARRGAGLGLTLVRELARVHGGTARAWAREGGGLVVRVDLPSP